MVKMIEQTYAKNLSHEAITVLLNQLILWDDDCSLLSHLIKSFQLCATESTLADTEACCLVTSYNCRNGGVARFPFIARKQFLLLALSF